MVLCILDKNLRNDILVQLHQVEYCTISLVVEHDFKAHLVLLIGFGVDM